MFNGCVKNEGYTFVELTVDNWREYFSDNVADVFEIEYRLLAEDRTNEWGEVTGTSYGVEKYARFKDDDRFAPLMQLTIELDCGYASIYERATIDVATQTITDIQPCEETDIIKGTQTTGFISDTEGAPFTALGLGQDDNESLSEDSTIVVSLYTLGEKIYRMKGWLVLKNEG
jgi:hypothetical protein